ncbi:Inner membrane protein CreD [Alteripontixanthobacter maritimus]|uniref:Inner membrane protein CreD n=1 Tax=Alteripontixanthobacter maritimus TaxID=2161824 RepID=A0A369QB42_9SPHN|nr:cell envelope integrity protein CreD [Alteripontixanthobacter maritimus]RDC60129.1 Inner membrane protein CreD [Alteripontixanthobacter maritimus]
MTDRSPGMKLLFAGLVGLALIVPLFMVYALVSDRQHQARIAQDSITAGWGGPQTLAGPLLVIPYRDVQVTSETQNGQVVTSERTVRRELYLSPQQHRISTDLSPEKRSLSIYETVTFTAVQEGSASFVLPDEFERLGIDRSDLLLDETEIRFGVSDPRGLQGDARLAVNGTPVTLIPGKGLNATGGTGFHGYREWDGATPLKLEYSYGVRGSRALAIVPRGGTTDWTVTSPWPHPGFGGNFLPDEKEIGDTGFSARWSVGNLALGEAMVSTAQPGPPRPSGGMDMGVPPVEAAMEVGAARSGSSMSASIRLVEPVDLYSQVDRSVKYGFLVIGFTFLAFLMFDIVGGARVAAAEYLLTGAALVLFFVLLLAFAEVIGFALAYMLAAAAIIGLLTAYSAAVLGSWVRARMIGGLLVGLYAALYVLLSLEALSLIVGSLLLFAALAGVMYATRQIEWSRSRTDYDAGTVVA